MWESRIAEEILAREENKIENFVEFELNKNVEK